MIHKLNQTLTDVGVGFVYIYNNDSNKPYASITVKDNGQGWTCDAIIKLTDKYFNWLKSWFYDVFKIIIEFDDIGSTF